jgi:hypothetical protein
MGIMKMVKNNGMNGTTSPSLFLRPPRYSLAGKVSVVEDGRMDGYYEEGEKYRNKRNYVPLVPAHKLIRVMFSMLVHQKCFTEGGK